MGQSDADLEQRLHRLHNTNDASLPNDEALAQRFQKVFDTELVVNQLQKDYSVPKNMDDKEVEQLLLEAETYHHQLDDDDDYLADILNDSQRVSNNRKDTVKVPPSPSHHNKLEAWQDAFLAHKTQMQADHDEDAEIILDDQSQQLLQQLKDQVAVESKYASFKQQSDQDLERRYLALKKDDTLTGNSHHHLSTHLTTSKTETGHLLPAGSVPKALDMSELHDEMDDWCCVCNEDATVECLDCDNDRFCQQCFYDGHQSSMADYEFTKHKAKKYTKHYQ